MGLSLGFRVQGFVLVWVLGCLRSLRVGIHFLFFFFFGGGGGGFGVAFVAIFLF